jgi:polycystin 1L2
MRRQKWGYFCSKWNLLELVIILASWSALAVFVKRAILAERDLQRYWEHRGGEWLPLSISAPAGPSFSSCQRETLGTLKAFSLSQALLAEVTAATT